FAKTRAKLLSGKVTNAPVLHSQPVVEPPITLEPPAQMSIKAAHIYSQRGLWQAPKISPQKLPKTLWPPLMDHVLEPRVLSIAAVAVIPKQSDDRLGHGDHVCGLNIGNRPGQAWKSLRVSVRHAHAAASKDVIAADS